MIKGSFCSSKDSSKSRGWLPSESSRFEGLVRVGWHTFWGWMINPTQDSESSRNLGVAKTFTTAIHCLRGYGTMRIASGCHALLAEASSATRGVLNAWTIIRLTTCAGKRSMVMFVCPHLLVRGRDRVHTYSGLVIPSVDGLTTESLQKKVRSFISKSRVWLLCLYIHIHI